jgi:RNA polymerase sigma factor (TIGR02999 family)
MSDNPGEVTILLRQWHAGDETAGEKIFRLLEPDLKRIAGRCLRRERPNHTLQRTELVNEGFFKLAEANLVVDWRDRGHFFAICTNKLRCLLIEYARRKPKAVFVSIENLPEGFMSKHDKLEVRLAVDSLLDDLEKESPITCAILVARTYLGYEVKEIADNFRMPIRTVERHLHNGRKWLFQRLSEKHDNRTPKE